MSDRSRLPLCAASVLVSLLIACGAASAADGKPARKPAPAAKPAAKTALLSPEQLRECLDQERRLQSETNEASKQKDALEAEKDALKRTGTALSEERTTVDPVNVEAMEAFNAKALANDRLIDAYEGKVAAFNARAEAMKTTRDGFLRQCDKRRYDERDEIDLRRKK